MKRVHEETPRAHNVARMFAAAASTHHQRVLADAGRNYRAAPELRPECPGTPDDLSVLLKRGRMRDQSRALPS